MLKKSPIIDNGYDSLKSLVFDTTTLKMKRKYLLNQFYINYSPTSFTSDTLIDLNFDNKLDYLIKYYGMCSTGSKNGIQVYLLSNNQSYTYDSTLSNLQNPTFYLKNKTITEFHIGFVEDMDLN